MPKETGFSSVASSDKGNLFPLGGIEYLDSPNSSEREDQCPSGSGFQKGSYSNGVVSGRQLLPVVLRAVGSSSGGSLRHEIQQEAPKVRLPLPGSGGRGLGLLRKANRVEPVEVYIPLSSLCSPRQGGWLAEILQRGRIFDSPFLANSELVPSFIKEMSSEVPITQERVLVPEVFKSGVRPQRPFSFKSSRLEVIKEAVMAEGLTDFCTDPG